MGRRCGVTARLKVVAIVPAAGSGKRLGLKTAKPFVLLKGKELVSYALGALDSSPSIDGIIAAADSSSAGRLRRLAKKYGFRKVMEVAAGGKTRAESVRNCLKRIDSSFDIVIIHDAARPFLNQSLIETCVEGARRFGACVAAVPESDTVKLARDGMIIRSTMDRDSFYRAQTPQAFRYDIIKTAYGNLERADTATDDSSLVEKMGVRVKLVKGSYRNIKITTREDLKMAEALLG